MTLSLLNLENDDALLQETGDYLLLEGQSVRVIIDDVDRTRNIVAYSVRVDNILTNKRDSCEFQILNSSGESYVPDMGDEVVIYDGQDKVFGGVITEMESTPTAYKTISYIITCQDYTRLFDHRLVPDGFVDMTVNEIIASLKTNYFPADFTINNVDADVTVGSINFNYRPLAKCIEDLANLINYDWYVDYDKDLHFFAKETREAPFSIADDNGKYQYDSLLIRRDNSQLRNTIIVRGGEYIASQSTFEIQTTGVDTVYPLPYRFSDFESTLTGTRLNVGIDNIDNANDYDALYNFQEKIIKFKDADRPSASKTLKVAGKPYLPVLVRYRSPAAIAATQTAEGGDGIYEFLINDKSIKSKEGARQRAQAEILAYAQTLSEGEFITETAGLKAGQMITVDSTSRGINERFMINKVTFTQFTADTWIYRVSLITSRTADLIDVLRNLLLQSTQQLDIDDNEVSDVLFDISDSAEFTDSVSTGYITSPPYLWGTMTWGRFTWS